MDEKAKKESTGSTRKIKKSRSFFGQKPSASTFRPASPFSNSNTHLNILHPIHREHIDIEKKANKAMNRMLGEIDCDPREAKVHFHNEKEGYVFIRAQAISFGFYEILQQTLSNSNQSRQLAAKLLFDFGKIVGRSTAAHTAAFLSTDFAATYAHVLYGLVGTMAHTGWGKMEILLESKLKKDEDFFMVYTLQSSCEAEAWISKHPSKPGNVCHMNAGFVSGWASCCLRASAVAVEVSCKANGHSRCTFVVGYNTKITELAHNYLLDKGNSSEFPFLHIRKEPNYDRDEFLMGDEKRSLSKLLRRSVSISGLQHV